MMQVIAQTFNMNTVAVSEIHNVCTLATGQWDHIGTTANCTVDSFAYNY